MGLRCRHRYLLYGWRLWCTHQPAVTIALAMFHGFDKAKVVPYIIAQMLGAFCSAALVYSLYSNLFTDYEIAHNFVRSSQDALATAGIFSTIRMPPSLSLVLLLWNSLSLLC